MYMIRNNIIYIKTRTGVLDNFFLAGNRMVALHLATSVFLAGNHISDEQRE